MNRKSVLRNRRRDLMRWSNGTFKETVLKYEPDSEALPKLLPKKKWCYEVCCEINGYRVFAADETRWDAIYLAWDCARWAIKEPEFDTKKYDWERINRMDPGAQG